MSVTLYDEALLRKIRRWVSDKDVTILGVDDSADLFKYKADIGDDKPLTLPLISISRDSRVNINSNAKKPLTYDGLKHESNGSITNQINVIPITINYQLNIYTRKDWQAQEYMRSFIFNLINFPRIDIEVPYNNSKLVMSAYINIDQEYSDNSDIPEKLIRDQFSRQTLSFRINANLYDYKTNDNWKIDCESMTLLLTDKEMESEGSININLE